MYTPRSLCVLVFLVCAYACLHITRAQQSPLHLLDQKVYDKAKCIDGSAPGFYYRLNNSSKNWIIWHQGGGWCYTTALCAARANTTLGSSTKWAKTSSFSGVLADDKVNNPLLYSWNVIYIPYCDGSSFTGMRDNVVSYNNQRLWFRGKENLWSVMTELKKSFKLNEAEDVIISGSSAGGLATYIHVDWWADNLPDAHVVGLPDAGYFLDAPDITGNYTHTKSMKEAFTLWNSTEGVNSACLAHYNQPEDQWHCIYAPYTYPFIKTPLFVLNSMFDSWQADNILLLGCHYGTSSCTPAQNNALENYGREFMTAVAPVFKNNKDAAWIDGCFIHTQASGTSTWNGIRVQGDTIMTAFNKWYENTKNPLWRVDTCNLPCNPTCPK